VADIVKVGESIEGLSIDGCSRDPMINRGLYIYKTRQCHRFTASFNVKSQIMSKVHSGIEKIDENAHCNLDAELSCDIAVIHSLDDRCSTRVSSNVSATHGANSWHFPKQTNVKISRAHQDILNAITKREQLSQQR